MQVKEIFKTLQGEGFFAGRPAIFIRLVGCNMWSGYAKDRTRDALAHQNSCALWCDTNFTKEGSKKMTESQLLDEVLALAGDIRFCVITGGEPLLQLKCCKFLKDAGFFVAIETNGTVSLKDAIADRTPPNWIVCSPKQPQEKLNLEYFDELKLVVPDYQPHQYIAFAQKGRMHTVGGERKPFLWLQPEDGYRQQEANQFAIETALQYPQWHVSVQTHKILAVD